MRDYFIFKINLMGGIVSPGLLYKILKAALNLGIGNVRFGARQQLLIQVHNDEVVLFQKELAKLDVNFETNTDQFPNVISSYCGEEVFRTGQWLGTNEYHTILDGLGTDARLKINISDSNQSFTPFFTGNLNFISSPEPHYWYLYIRPKQQNTVHKWPELIYTNHIGKLSSALEKSLLQSTEFDLDRLFKTLKKSIRPISLPITQELILPSFSLPYYEGFNRYESRTWLGLYSRNEQFSVPFLLEVCDLCLKSRIGEICTTPWRSLIIKGIEDSYREQWSDILSKHHINVRHAASELAWQTEDDNEIGAQLKKELISYIAKEDTRTFGLCFGIQTRPKSEVFGSVLIRKRPLFSLGSFSLGYVYDIYHTEHFNPNSRNYFPFELGLLKSQLPNQLVRICRRFNNLRLIKSQNNFSKEQPPVPKSELARSVYQCPNCFTVYDEHYGDPSQGILANTTFEDLPEDYCCSTCETPKSEIEKMDNFKVMLS